MTDEQFHSDALHIKFITIYLIYFKGNISHYLPADEISHLSQVGTLTSKLNQR